MSLLRLMLIISCVAHHTRAADRPVVTLTPNWNKIFRKRSISLRCNVETAGQKGQTYYWYRNNRKLQSYGPEKQISYAEMDDTGNYQCSYGGSARSYPVQLEISKDWLILQANSVYEGDTLFLRCHGWDSTFEEKAKFFKDDALFYAFNSTFKKEKITKEATGQYRCERERWKVLFYTKETAKTFVTVYELFSEPSLKLIESPVTEGDGMTLRCDTSLASPRKNTKLQFAFYRDKLDVQVFSISDTYRVGSAQLEDTGYYICQVRTVSDTVRKISKALSIQIQALFSEPVLSSKKPHITEGDDITLKCDTTLATPKKNTNLQFAFYKDDRTVQDFTAIDTYQEWSAKLEDSGNYACEVKTANATVRKRSKNTFVQIKAANGQIQMTLSANEAVLGDNIVLSCESTFNSFPVRYTFYHNGTSLSNITVYQKGTATVTLEVTTQTMAGFYLCMSDNGIEQQRQLSNNVSLLIIDPVSGVKIILDKTGEKFALGDSLTFTCSVERGTSPSFQWTHNGKVVEKRSWVFQLRDDARVLYIDFLHDHHAGSYQCNVTNKASTNTFSVISNTQTIKILEHSPVGESIFTEDDDPAEQSSFLWFLLGVLILAVALFGVLFVYRHKVGSIVSWFQRQSNPGPTFAKARARVGPIATQDLAPRPNSTNNVQEDYSTVQNVVPCADGDVCYSYIQINQIQDSTDNSRGQDEFSVTYSAVKCPGKKMNGIQTVDHTELYENLSSKTS